MKLKKNLRIIPIGNQHIIAAERENIDMTRIVSLNDTAAWLWKHAEGAEFTAQQLADALCEEYDVAPEKALADVERTLAVWKQNNLLDESDDQTP